MKKATHQQTRSHNTRLVLRTIYHHDTISRAEISRTTGLTRASVSSIAAELLEEGLVAEVGQGKSIGGKPPTLLSVVDGSRHLIGVDLADGELRGAVLDLRGRISRRAGLAIGERTGEDALALVFQLIDQLLDAAEPETLLGIGVGTPGLVDSTKGQVLEALSFDWQQVPLGEELEHRYGLPSYIVNDCHAAAMGEHCFGDTTRSGDLVVIKVGHGTGAGMVINGRLHCGDRFGAGEIGHLVVVEGGELCACGRRGCLETLTSSRAVVRRARALARHNPNSLLHHLVDSPDEITIDVVLRAIESGDEGLPPVITEAGRYLGVVAASVVGVLNIGRIVIAGDVSRFGGLLLDAAVAEVNHRSLPGLAGETSVTCSTLGSDITVLGAAALLLAQELAIV